jgi:glycine cleavage system aminomethyltransferase T
MPFPSFDILYGESSHGKRKMWSVGVSERDGSGVITVTHGYEDGKKVVNERLVTTGKNIGMAYVTAAEATTGNTIDVMVRDKPVKAVLVSLPFYKRKG